MVKAEARGGLITLEIEGNTPAIFAEITQIVRAVTTSVFEDFSKLDVTDEQLQSMEGLLTVGIMSAIRKGVKEGRERHEAAENPV